MGAVNRPMEAIVNDTEKFTSTQVSTIPRASTYSRSIWSSGCHTRGTRCSSNRNRESKRDVRIVTRRLAWRGAGVVSNKEIIEREHAHAAHATNQPNYQPNYHANQPRQPTTPTTPTTPTNHTNHANHANPTTPTNRLT